ncbi:MAG: hypothetical protein WCT99_09650 [Bacteroidota bacterium]
MSFYPFYLLNRNDCTNAIDSSYGVDQLLPVWLSMTLSVSYRTVRNGFSASYCYYDNVEEHQRTIPERTGTYEATNRMRYCIL